jgi:hypothetical protein
LVAQVQIKLADAAERAGRVGVCFGEWCSRCELLLIPLIELEGGKLQEPELPEALLAFSRKQYEAADQQPGSTTGKLIVLLLACLTLLHECLMCASDSPVG